MPRIRSRPVAVLALWAVLCALVVVAQSEVAWAGDKPARASSKKSAKKRTKAKTPKRKRSGKKATSKKKRSGKKTAAKDKKRSGKKTASSDKKRSGKKTASSDKKGAAKRTAAKKKPAPENKPYVAPKRTVEEMAFAIGTSNGHLSQASRQNLARLLISVAGKHNFDPLSGWAIIDHESDWRAHAVSADGHDIGLAQVRYTVSRACQKDRTSKACLARREALLNPSVNIHAMAGAISAWRKLCHERTGRPANMQNWLAGYGGFSRPRQNKLCGRQLVKTKRGERWKDLPVPKGVQEIIDARKQMIRKMRKAKRSRK